MFFSVLIILRNFIIVIIIRLLFFVCMFAKFHGSAAIQLWLLYTAQQDFCIMLEKDTLPD